MERVRNRHLKDHIGHDVRVTGWLHVMRLKGSVNFLHLRDAWGVTQVVLGPGEELDKVSSLLAESVLEIEGRVMEEPQAPGGCEIHEPRIRVVSPVLEALPITVNKRVMTPHLDTFLDHAAVGLRHPLKRALFRTESQIASAFRSALQQRDFTEIATPKLVSASTESGANVFPVEYFGRTAYLARSPQFYKQMMVGVFERVFEVGPVFRAEPHATTRHLNEYVSLDAEMRFIDSHRDLMDLLSEVVRHILAQLAANCADGRWRLST